MEPLVEIPRQEWPNLIGLYDTQWPKGSPASCVLDTQRTHPNFMETFDFKVYSAFGEKSHGIVAISDQFGWYEVMICPINDISKIEKASLNTKLIDWDREVIIPAAAPDVEDCLRKLEEKLNIKIKILEHVNIHVLGKQTKIFEDLKTPPNTRVKSLKPEDVKVVDETWTYTNKYTHSLFEILSKNGLTYVLYVEDKPAAWVAIATDGAFTHWYCLEPYRRRGYGEFIIKYAINDRLKKEKHCVAFTVEKNKVAQNMFDRFGFEVFGQCKWLSVKRQ